MAKAKGSKKKDGKASPAAAATAKPEAKASKRNELSSTQRRNARKRRAKQTTTQQTKPGKGTSDNGGDPSTQYLKNPKAAPLVQAAKRFFADRLPQFPIYQKGPLTGWRTVSKLPVRRYQQEGAKRSRVMIGMFQPHSHQVVVAKTQSYPAHHPSINHAMATLAMACQEMGIDVYNETDGSGYLRYVAMNVERSTGKVQMTLIWKDNPYETPLQIGKKKRKKSKAKGPATDDSEKKDNPGKTQLERLISQLLKVATPGTEDNNPQSTKKPKSTETDGSKQQQSATAKDIELASWQLHSLWVHYNAAWKHSNAIFDIHSSSDAWYHVYGPPNIQEQLTLPTVEPPKATLHFAPNVFRQATLDAFAHIVTAIRQRIQKLSTTQSKNKENNHQELLKCVELYGGVGTIGLHLLDLPSISSLICSDENPYNQDCFSKSLALLPPARSQKATYVPLNASQMVTDPRRFLQGTNCDVLVVDPPRKGLDEAVINALTQNSHNNIRLLVYVSCGFDAFQRDCQSLTGENNTQQQQKWTLEHAEGHILFPGSNAIETLAFFTPTST